MCQHDAFVAWLMHRDASRTCAGTQLTIRPEPLLLSVNGLVAASGDAVAYADDVTLPVKISIKKSIYLLEARPLAATMTIGEVMSGKEMPMYGH